MAVSVGLKSTGRELKDMLVKTGFKMSKLNAPEKLDILEEIGNQLHYHLAARSKCHLSLEELSKALEKEEQPPKNANDPRQVILALEQLRHRERARLGIHVSAEQLEEFEDQLETITNDDFAEVFGIVPVDMEDGDDLFDENGNIKINQMLKELNSNPAKRPRVSEEGGAASGQLAIPTSVPASIPTNQPRALTAGPDSATTSAVESGQLALAGAPSASAPLELAATPPATDVASPKSEDVTAPAWMSEEAAMNLGVKRTAACLALETSSMEDSSHDKKELRILDRINPDALQEHLPALGIEDKKDNLTEIRGIGKWIKRRLNKVKINSFGQLANMTPEIEKAVEKAIRFFPGRIQHDQWIWQAKRLADKEKAWIVNPKYTRSAGSPMQMMDGVEYERDLLDIARHYGTDGKEMGLDHAECLWFAAMDGRQVTVRERFTLHYIQKKFKFSNAAKEYLEKRLQGEPVPP